jgi:RNA polymerase sigma-70 factor, ECF subfamily
LETSSVRLARIGDISEWLPDNGQSAERLAVVRAQVDAVSRAVARLSTAQRMVFLLRYIEDLDLKEIGQSTGMTQDSIESNLHRALEKVRKQIIGINVAHV